MKNYIKKIQSYQVFKPAIFFASLVFLFILSISVWYSPMIFKGYNFTTNGADILVRARNNAIVGIDANENKLNVVLAPKLIKDGGVVSQEGNKLAPGIYSYLIKAFNLNSVEKVVFINCIIFALSLIFFSLATYLLFGFRVSLFSALIFIFLPTIWVLPYSMVGYEFATLFFSIFIFFFALGSKKIKIKEDILESSKSWGNKISFLISGIFLALSCLSREAFFVIAFLFFIFLLIKARKVFIYPALTAGMILAIFWLPGFVSSQNVYSTHFIAKTGGEAQGTNYTYYGHLFPDPYTFHFEKEEFINEKLENINNEDLMTKVSINKILANTGFKQISLIERIKVGFTSLFRYIFRFFSITEIGGVMIFFFAIFGAWFLKRKRKFWFNIFSYWFVGSAIILSFAVLVSRNHLMDFAWSISVSVACGIYFLGDIIADRIGKNKNFVMILIITLVVYNLILCSHVAWGQNYDQSIIPSLNAYSEKIKTIDIKSADVISAPFAGSDIYYLNFLTEKSTVVFRIETIEKLLKENKLKKAFEDFGIKYVVGYDAKLSEEIKNATGAKIIADSDIELNSEKTTISNKNWFLNLVK
jgi:hypothetical protein